MNFDDFATTRKIYLTFTCSHLVVLVSAQLNWDRIFN